MNQLSQFLKTVWKISSQFWYSFFEFNLTTWSQWLTAYWRRRSVEKLKFGSHTEHRKTYKLPQPHFFPEKITTSANSPLSVSSFKAYSHKRCPSEPYRTRKLFSSFTLWYTFLLNALQCDTGVSSTAFTLSQVTHYFQSWQYSRSNSAKMTRCHKLP